jgi:FAD:protein FMN transferase
MISAADGRSDNCWSKKRGACLVGVFLVLLLGGCSNGNHEQAPFRYSGWTMGTTFNVTVAVMANTVQADELKAGIDRRLSDVNSSMSTFLEDSELSRLNQSRSTDWLPVSDQLVTVLAEAQRISRLTDGAFDVTVGPLVNLWGFGPEERDGDNLPSASEIAARLHKCGYRNLQVREEPPSVRKLLPEIYIDLSALAKGYGVDRVADYLESVGIKDYLVEIGGELRVKGKSHRGDAWRIGIEKPSAGERVVQKVLVLDDMAVATSGDYRSYIEVGGERFSHTIDPRTGRPIAHKLASVTVLSHTTMAADALATGLMVLGPDEGFVLAEQNAWAALFIIKAANGFIEKSTTAFSTSMR